MKCPYNHRSETQFSQWTQELNEDSTHAVSGDTVTKTVFVFCDCQKENCGAWHDGRCHYEKTG